jgi:hypothetical protein
VFNAFGCLDNLAWIWVHEKELKGQDGNDLKAQWVGLGKSYRYEGIPRLSEKPSEVARPSHRLSGLTARPAKLRVRIIIAVAILAALSALYWQIAY